MRREGGKEGGRGEGGREGVRRGSEEGGSEERGGGSEEGEWEEEGGRVGGRSREDKGGSINLHESTHSLTRYLPLSYLHVYWRGRPGYTQPRNCIEVVSTEIFKSIEAKSQSKLYNTNHELSYKVIKKVHSSGYHNHPEISS